MPGTPDIQDMTLAQGPAKIASAADIERDEEGITKPNFHRRIDEELSGNTSFQYIVEVFICDGATRSFTLANKGNIDSITEVSVAGTITSSYTFNATTNVLTLSATPVVDTKVSIMYLIELPNSSPDTHSLFVGGTNSFRSTTQNTYIADSEIP